MAAVKPSHGEGGSRVNPSEGTLGDAMRAPSNTPDVVVLSRVPDELDTAEVLDPKEDLWLTTADGRYSSSIIPVRVGLAPHEETFQVHRNVLLRSEWFRKALCGGFVEASNQTLDLPEDDPAIFHFVVAYLYENTYVPTKALSTVLVPDEDKGKGREGELNSSSPDSDSDSSNSSASSNSSVRSRQRRERHRRRTEREAERLRQKHPGMHRPECSCPTCIVSLEPCYSCGFTARVPQPNTLPPPPPIMPPFPGVRSHRHRRRGPDGRVLPRALSPPPPPAPYDRARIQGEDMRTWLIAYAFNLDVYICADKFLLEDFKQKVARVTIDMLETAGSDAATIEVLELCTKLYDGVSAQDALLKMVFARVGFLQTTLWRTAPFETNNFLVENPEVAALVLKEMAIRGEGDLRAGMPSMERNLAPQLPVMGMPPPHFRGPPNRIRPYY